MARRIKMDIPFRFNIIDDEPDLLWQFTAWLQKVVGYARLEYLRKLDYKKLETSLDEASNEIPAYEDPIPVSKDGIDFEGEGLSEAFAGLNQLRRQILILTFVEGLTAQETADKLNCTVDYVYLHKHRAIKALRDQLMGGGGNHRK
jgi:RNA polymerase sigma factor (sigma-70 family)